MVQTQSRTYADVRSVSELVEDASSQITRLVRDEMRLARLEVQDKAGGMARGVGLAGAGALPAFCGGIALTGAAVFALALVLPDWASAAIVGAALLAVGGTVAYFGKSTVSKAAPPVPTEAVEGVRADVDAVRNGSRR
ncbi:phage holin family protein [Nocardia bovistercoris]|uniref:Phage holin family protein n=1 Tax=Nocardia bovistercoris TaxID=2785916 RepID=A0A931N5K1_9NOCA|nr:phage holin family protein [Nocardia bovistercoris]MBH0779496.1 phage holin family protein [Nocardia bovistercoris]